jgi:phosphatidylserine/phosphatidylglycerophosphate/cardiolipin synthase-like enzyme
MLASGGFPMIAVDRGLGLKNMLSRAAGAATQRDELYVVVPFIEPSSSLWLSTLRVAGAGARVYLITNPPKGAGIEAELLRLRELGGHVTVVRNLHAKVFLWFDRVRGISEAFVGSHNFTCFSENTSVEFGFLIREIRTTKNTLINDIQDFISHLIASRSSQPYTGRRTPSKRHCNGHLPKD